MNLSPFPEKAALAPEKGSSSDSSLESMNNQKATTPVPSDEHTNREKTSSLAPLPESAGRADVFRWESKAGVWFLVAVIALTSLIFIAGNVRGANGELAGVIDDVYIHFQYAKTWAQGQPFVYSPGDGPQAGNTSFLYPILLAIGYKIGFQEAGLMAWAVGMGFTFFLASMLLFQATLRNTIGVRAASYFALTAPFCSVFYYHALGGMEVSLQMVLLAGTLYFGVRWITDETRASLAWFTVFAALAPLARPEGVTVLAGYGFVVLVSRFKRFDKSVLAAFFLSGLPFLTYMLVHYAIFGQFSPNSALGKGYFHAPGAEFANCLLRTGEALLMVVRYAFLGHEKIPFLTPGLVFVSLLGAWGLLRKARPSHKPIVGFFFITLLGAIPPSMTFSYHWGSLRYYASLFPIFFWLAAAGWYLLEKYPLYLPKRFWQGVSLFGVAVTLGYGLYSHSAHYRIYTQSAADLHYQQIATGRYIRDNLPKNAVVAMNDAGAIAYFGERRTYDFVGLTTNGRALAYRDGQGATFEMMERLPEKDRPTHFACFPHWLKRPEYFERELATFTSPFHMGVGNRQHHVLLADRQIWRGSALPADEVVPTDRVLVDELDTADWQNEGDHGYRITEASGEKIHSRGDWRRYHHPLLGFEVAEGQRAVKPGQTERFTVNVTPGKDVLLVARMDPSLPTEATLSLNGKPSGLLLKADHGREWKEATLRLPASLITDSRLEVGLTPTKRRYGSCHYWFYQEP